MAKLTKQQREELRGILANLERAEFMGKDARVTQAVDALARFIVRN